MKINGDRPVNIRLSDKNVNKVSEEKPVNIQRKAEPQFLNKDRVEISGKAKEVARLMEELSKLPDIRRQKVQELREAIKSGRYRIDSVKLAEKILREI